jgi:outer membrane lipoprotein-sorting protein
MKKNIIALGLLSAGLLFSANSIAALNLEGLSPEQAGLAIVTEADKRETGFGNSSAGMKMTLINRKGKKSIRNLRSKVLEQLEQGDKSLSIFDEPADVKGTAMLTHSHGLDPDDQWLYLPALKRVKRISSKNKSGPFMGSEFAFEDLGSQEIEKYSYTLLGEEQLDGVDVYKTERIPQYKHSGYTKQIAWTDQEHLRTLKVEYYDRKGSLLKTLSASDFKQFKDQFWRPHRMFMQNHQTKKATELLFENYVFNDASLKESDFVNNSLKRIR